MARHAPPAPPAPVPAIDPVWLARAQGAYGAVARADGPAARWVLQGSVALSLCTTAHSLYAIFAIIFGTSVSETTVRPNPRWILQGWMLLIRGAGFGPPNGPMRGDLALSRLKAYATAAPPGNFIVTDMDRTGAGQWDKWHGDWGLPFIWTSVRARPGRSGGLRVL